MNKTFLIIREEFIRVVFRKSFVVTLLLVPLVPFFISLVSSSANITEAPTNRVSEILNGPVEQQAEGFVDQSGLIHRIPLELKTQLLPYADETLARQAQQAGDISAFYIIPVDFLETGKIFYYREDFNPLRGMIRSTPIQQALLFNLTDGNLVLYRRLANPMNMESHFLRDTSARQLDENSFNSFFLPYIVALVFYIVIMGSATLMLNTITTEKENRVMEILLSSASPAQIIIGKMIALGLVGLFQTVVWGLLAALLFSLGGEGLSIPPEFLAVPVSLLFWAMLFFILGYAVYAGIMSGIGALIPGTREASQIAILMSLPLMLPLFFLTVLARSPNGGLAVGLSLFPLTAPIAMIMRLSIAAVPLWQVAVSAGLLLVSGFLVLRLSSGLFRAQNLLSGQKFRFKTFLRALMGKA